MLFYRNHPPNYKSFNMRSKSLLYTACSLAIAGSAALFLSSALVDNSPSFQPRDMKNGLNKLAYDCSYRGSAEWWFNNRKDPVTGQLNIAAMVQAGIDANSFENNSNAELLNLQWSEMGPDNVGGRTRALLIDRNNSNLLYTGGVGGGLWYSYDGAAHWYRWGLTNGQLPYSDTLANMAVSCITQTSNGDVYFGTGEGLYGFYGQGTGGFIGGGIWKKLAASNTFTRIVQPTIPNNFTIDWYGTNDLAASPTDPMRVYAATERGFLISSDGGANWVDGITSPANSRTTDVTVAPNGAVAVCYGGRVYISPSGDPNTYVSNSVGGTQLPNVVSGRVTLAYSPDSDGSDYLYACLVNSAGVLTGIYRTMNATNTTPTWYLIGPGGSPNTFNPFNNQGTYDNAIAVYPGNKDRILVGGVSLWRYQQTQSLPLPPAGQWTNIDSQFESTANPWYVHADKHEIVFERNNPNKFYISCDGGIFRSLDGGSTFSPQNNGYAVLQNYSVGFSKTGNEYMGGTQDNGTQYIDHTGNTWNGAQHIMGGDGSYAEISAVNPAALFGGSYYGVVERSSNYGASMSDFYNVRVTDQPGFLTSTFASFVTPFVLYENLSDVNNPDSILFVNGPQSFVVGSADGLSAQYNSTLPMVQIAASIDPSSVTITCGSQIVTDNGAGLLVGSVNGSGVNTINYNTGAFDVTFSTVPPVNTVISVSYDLTYTTGDVLTLNSGTSNFPFAYTLTSPLLPGDSLAVADRITSKLAVGYNGAVYLIRKCLDFSTTPEWIKIGGAFSRNEFGVGSPLTGEVQTMTWSGDGDHLFVGTASGNLFRISHINQIVDSAGNADVDSNVTMTPLVYAANPDAIPRTTKLAQFTGRPITGLGVDPNNSNRLMITLGGYAQTTSVYYCDSAATSVINASNTTKVSSKQGNLPGMPCYDAIIDMTNGANVVLGTEYGTWTTDNINVASPTWTKEINGMANTVVTMVRQQTLRNWVTTNTGQIWVGTHGRGMFSSNTLGAPLGNNELPPFGNVGAAFQSSLKVFPNPMKDGGTVSFFMPSNSKAFMEIYSISGKRVQRIDLGKLTIGSYNIEIDAAELSKGTYFVNIIAGELKAGAKFVKID